MKKICTIALLLMSIVVFGGCDQLMQQVETVAQQINVEEVMTDVIENIDWSELKEYTQQGYDSLTKQFPALKGENIKQFLKDNGLDLINKYLDGTDEAKQETARKLGEIIKILDPELTDEVDSVISG